MSDTLRKMSFATQVTPEEEEAKMKLATTLLKDPTVKVMLDQKVELYEGFFVPRLTKQVIVQNPYKVHRWLESFRPCISCKGLDDCKQQDKGHMMLPVCDVFLQLSKASCKHMKEKEAQLAHLQNYVYNDVPKNMQCITFKSIDAEKESVENPAYYKAVSELMEMCTKKSSVYLYGPFGTGKTYLSVCACNYYAKKGIKVAFVHWPSFVTRMVDLVKSQEHTSVLERLKHVPFLVIDEIGGESVTQWNRDQILLPLINTRYEENLPTWFTSNCDYKELEKHFSVSSKMVEEKMKANRILERIEVMAKSKTLTGKDRRQLVD